MQKQVYNFGLQLSDIFPHVQFLYYTLCVYIGGWGYLPNLHPIFHFIYIHSDFEENITRKKAHNLFEVFIFPTPTIKEKKNLFRYNIYTASIANIIIAILYFMCTSTTLLHTFPLFCRLCLTKCSNLLPGIFFPRCSTFHDALIL